MAYCIRMLLETYLAWCCPYRSLAPLVLVVLPMCNQARTLSGSPTPSYSICSTCLQISSLTEEDLVLWGCLHIPATSDCPCGQWSVEDANRY
ncbi:hypothetical protein CC86DRAFT_31880 [Ophiobolus disseminans]|uniref:Uncharacterized protein n=1 Tax=Ophiobolus disseminans TaxID=1469910 RepID=A0A6A7A1H7_9PLEO|nr:hypothetical protein CC86DRAFT_31880 [Ophiobolus disseminans]